MRRQGSKWRRIVIGLILGLPLATNAGCYLDYADWTNFNDTVVAGAVDGTGAFVEDTLNSILTSIFNGIRGMPDGG